MNVNYLNLLSRSLLDSSTGVRRRRRSLAGYSARTRTGSNVRAVGELAIGAYDGYSRS
jgi:hypothetical protein